MSESNEVRIFRWVGALPTLAMVCGGLICLGIMFANLTKLTTTVEVGFQDMKREIRDLPIQTRQIGELEKRSAETAARIEAAVASGVAARDRLATTFAQRDAEHDRGLNELRQAFALDHAELVRIAEAVRDLVFARDRPLPGQQAPRR